MDGLLKEAGGVWELSGVTGKWTPFSIAFTQIWRFVFKGLFWTLSATEPETWLQFQTQHPLWEINRWLDYNVPYSAFLQAWVGFGWNALLPVDDEREFKAFA